MDKAKVSRTGDAIATAPGAVAISGVGTVQVTGVPPARSYYREQIAQIVPQHLLDRDAELAELAAFSLISDDDAPAYRWWRAPKWSGKTALMAAFALEPPAGVRVVAFFVTARWAGHDTRAAFVDIVGDQLAEILAEPSPTSLPPHVRDSYLNGLFYRAAERCREEGERLVLLVDGLDEDRGTPHDHPAQGTSIAAALPARPPAGMRILVSGRPNPPLPGDVPADHPLRTPAVSRPLDASPHAKVAEDMMLLELDRVLHSSSDEQDLLGLLTAARGGLTATDLAELTGQSSRQVRRRLRGVVARTFDARSGHWRRDTEVYMLGHEDLQTIATEELGEQRLEQYRQRLHDWAVHYSDRGWPPDTPEYLLRGYHRLLANTNDVTRMTALATDPARHNRMLDLSGGDTTALLEISIAQDHNVRRRPPDLLAMLRLAIYRDHLLTRNNHIPQSLPAQWARHGHVDRAEALANSITDPVTRCAAVAAVAMTVASTGDPLRARSLFDRAKMAALNMTKSHEKARALLHLSWTATSMGDLEQAEAIARGILVPAFQAKALAYLAKALCRSGEKERARTLVGDAETMVLNEDERGPWEYTALMQVASAYLHTGDLDRAEAIARGFDQDPQAWPLRELADAATEAGEWDLAEAIAHDLPDPAAQSEAFARIAVRMVRSGHTERASSLFDHSQAILSGIADIGARAAAQADLATMAAQAGDTERARSLIEEVDLLVHDVADVHNQMRTLKNLAAAIMQCGDLARAEEVARSIADPTHRTLALVNVAVALVRANEFERAEALTFDCSDVSERPHPCARVAEAMAKAGDLLRAESVIRNIPALRHRELTLGRVAVAHALAGDVNRAEAITRSYIASSWQGGPLAQIAAVLAQNGEIERAETIACNLTDSDDRAWVLGQLASVRAQAGCLKRAHTLLDQATTAASNIMDPEEKFDVFRQLADVSVEMGDGPRYRSLVDRIVHTTDEMASPDGRALALAWLVEAHVQGGDLNQAYSAVDGIANPDSRLWVLPRLVEAFARAGDVAQVRTLIDYVEADARSRTNLGERAWALGKIAAGLAQAEEFDRARSLVLEAESIAWGITKLEVRDWVLEHVTETHVALGDLDLAKTAADNVTESGRRDQALAHLATAVAEDGDLEQARIIARGIAEPDQQARVMLELVQVLASNNERVSAGPRGSTTVQMEDHSDVGHQSQLMAESLRLTKWEDCLETLVELVPAAAATALRELESLGWLTQQTDGAGNTTAMP